MSRTTIEHLDLFWEMVDESLNAVLFVAIGMEFLVLTFSISYLMRGTAGDRDRAGRPFRLVGVPVWLLRRSDRFDASMIGILTWGGLRGGISVALALSLPEDPPVTPFPGAS